MSIVVVVVILWYAIFRFISSSHVIHSYQLPVMQSDTVHLNEKTLKIGSFNIAHGRGGKKGASNRQSRSKEDLLQHLDNIAMQIKDAELDIIVLNEVDFSAAWSFHVNQASHIAEQAGYPYLVEQRNMDVTFPFYEYKFGNAILSRHPVVESEFLEFTPYSIWEAQLVGNHNGMLSMLQTPLGQIGVIAIHLEYRSEEIRVDAARQINNLAKASKLPIVAAGDFNSTPIAFSGARVTSSGLNALSCLLGEGGFQASPNIKNVASYFTFPSEQPAIKIDWVLETGTLEFIKGDVHRSDLSDHFMVTSVLKTADNVESGQSLQAGVFAGEGKCK